MELVPGDQIARRIELTAWCAAVEHWLGRHADAHRRLVRAWDDLPDHTCAEACVVQVELAVDGIYELDFEQTITMGQGALEVARGLGDGALIAAAASALALGEAASGASADARRHRDEAAEQIERLSDAALAPRLEALYYLGWAENYLERYDDAIAHAQRGIAIARATGEGRLLVPLMLVQGYPFEAQGRLAEAIAMCETAVEIARLAAHPHYLFWALFELGWARYFAGDPDAAIVAHEESVRVGGRLTHGTMPSAGGGPGWGLAVCPLRSRQPGGDARHGARPRRRTSSTGRSRPRSASTGRTSRSPRSRSATSTLRRDVCRPRRARRGEPRPAPAVGAGSPRAGGRAARPGRARRRRPPRHGGRSTQARAGGAWLHAAYSRSLLGRCLAAGGERVQAIEQLRQAERELDTFGSVRPRDEARRELRKLGARSEPRGPASAGDSGVAALTKRELEIAGLVTDRMTNREIAAALFLSDKTVESHLRNLFMKLGVSSRTEVARTIERDRASAGTGPG